MSRDLAASSSSVGEDWAEGVRRVDPLAEVAGRKLNLGCAHFPLAGYLNVDLSLRTRAALLCNLDGTAFPFADASFDAIVASHILEHLADPFAAMGECHRLLRPGGVLLVKVPHFTRGFTHPEHKCGFDVSFPLFFDPKMTPWYEGTPFALEHMRLRWNAQPLPQALGRVAAEPGHCAHSGPGHRRGGESDSDGVLPPLRLHGRRLRGDRVSVSQAGRRGALKHGAR